MAQTRSAHAVDGLGIARRRGSVVKKEHLIDWRIVGLHLNGNTPIDRHVWQRIRPQERRVGDGRTVRQVLFLDLADRDRSWLNNQLLPQGEFY